MLLQAAKKSYARFIYKGQNHSLKHLSCFSLWTLLMIEHFIEIIFFLFVIYFIKHPTILNLIYPLSVFLHGSLVNP